MKIVKANVFDYASTLDKVFLPHIVNNIGAFGGGFTAELGRRFPSVANDYYDWFDSGKIQLGNILVFPATQRLSIIHMCGQHNIIPVEKSPIRYGALVDCMRKVRDVVLQFDKASIVTIWFGCGLARGNQETILSLMNEIWHNIDTVVCEV